MLPVLAGVAFLGMRAEVTRKLDPEARIVINRHFERSPILPARFAQNWNRSCVMEPEGKPVGVVVLLHGLTDSPSSLRHVARRYRDRGSVAIGICLRRACRGSLRWCGRSRFRPWAGKREGTTSSTRG